MQNQNDDQHMEVDEQKIEVESAAAALIPAAPGSKINSQSGIIATVASQHAS